MMDVKLLIVECSKAQYWETKTSYGYNGEGSLVILLVIRKKVHDK